jgi:hypothetical protein
MEEQADDDRTHLCYNNGLEESPRLLRLPGEPRYFLYGIGDNDDSCRVRVGWLTGDEGLQRYVVLGDVDLHAVKRFTPFYYRNHLHRWLYLTKYRQPVYVEYTWDTRTSCYICYCDVREPPDTVHSIQLGSGVTSGTSPVALWYKLLSAQLPASQITTILTLDEHFENGPAWGPFANKTDALEKLKSGKY